MAGSEVPEEHSSAEGSAHQSTPHKVKTFACTHCGASVSLRNPQSLSVVCHTCKSIIDTSNESYEILQFYRDSLHAFSPIIELGHRGELFGKKWEVIGFMARQDLDARFDWTEYLLFNPHDGYRWLTLSDGHWNFVTPIKEKPEMSAKHVRYKGKQYKVFTRGEATNLFVLGEFYWRVTIDRTVHLEDYIRPPEVLSFEAMDNEENWSLGVYVEAKVIETAFKLKKEHLPHQSGIAPNQPSKNSAMFYKMLNWWLVFIVLLTAIQAYDLCTCTNKVVFSDNQIAFTPNCKSPSSTATTVFDLNKDKANVKIELGADVDNSWFYFGGDLVNKDTGVAYPFERSIESYHGYDDGIYWAEGSNIAHHVLIPSVPAGHYFIDYDYESGGFNKVNAAAARHFSLTVWRDVYTWADYLWCLFIVSILPLIYWFLSISDENVRWSQSDYSSVGKS